MMVDFIVKSKKDTPPNRLRLEMLFSMLIIHIKTKVKKGLATSFFFSRKMPEIWFGRLGGPDDTKRKEKKEVGGGGGVGA